MLVGHLSNRPLTGGRIIPHHTLMVVGRRLGLVRYAFAWIHLSH